MKVTLFAIGKTTDPHILSNIENYCRRLSHYCTFQFICIEDVKNAAAISHVILKQKEGESVLKKITSKDYVIVLDEKGKEYSSAEFALFTQGLFNKGISHVVFIIGGAFGFSDDVYERADLKMALSKFTFTHQMARLIFIEQLYRCFTILKGEKYHH